MEWKRKYSYEDLRSLFDALSKTKESNELEFKTAAGGFPRSFWETYSSFANTYGGSIIFGIKEHGDELLFDNLTKEQVEKYQRDFFNNMHNKQNVNIPLLSEKDVQIVEYNGHYFLHFYVPRVEPGLRPVFCGSDPYTGTYRRDIDGDYHCTPQEVTSMFADANLSNTADGKILEGFGMEDLDLVSIRQYRRLFEQSNPDHVWNALEDSDFLEKLNVFRKDRKSGAKGVTLAGLMMFGTYSSIVDANPNFFPDYQEIENPKDRWINRIYPDGNWESNLFMFYRRVLPILQGFLPQPFVLEGNTRINETSAHVAVREAFTNAIVHADYSVNASLNVYKYPNKIIFSNPGTMLVSIRQYYQGGESVCRNKYLQTLFSFLGSAEKAGSGADKIIRGWSEQNWKKPYLQEKNKPNKVVLTMTMESLIDDNIIQELKNSFGDMVDALPREQLLSLAFAFTEEEITNERLQNVLDMHRSDISDMLGEMCRKGLLASVGKGRGTRYHIAGKELPNLASKDVNLASNDANLASNDANLASNDANLASNDANLASNDANLASNDANLASNDANLASNDANLASNDANLASNGANLASNSQKRRYSKEELRKMIVDFCDDWKSAEEIAIYVNRDKNYIRNEVLSCMEADLMQKYDFARHPRQKYRRRRHE